MYMYMYPLINLTNIMLSKKKEKELAEETVQFETI